MEIGKRTSRNCPVLPWLTSLARMENYGSIKYSSKMPWGCGILIQFSPMCLVGVMGEHYVTQQALQGRKLTSESIFIHTLETMMDPSPFPPVSFDFLLCGLFRLSSLQSCLPGAYSTNTCSNFLSEK